ncbi:holo-ACP synthase [Propioniciclava tarda]|uniref:Holo-[acyl-carrier-protein] synthase n=1 Tax=Propioniciclava tarda TaxID=433330 RepID=A0A4Q9KJE8_PROTD|nr:holo-ACP synthase [Propioniciclava tarda]TBT92190.1 holo-ACP synthase [Propioniciclava tarda]SMO82148.1 holo-[acyl-carrier protein] synthase [Propioniciclava tarda]
MIVGIGVDVCSLERFAAASGRPGVLDRLLTPAEQDGRPETLAGRFAAKEALAKALGAPSGLVWTDCVVTSDADGRPALVLSGTVAARASELGVTRTHVSISHDAGVAVAMVICEAGER